MDALTRRYLAEFEATIDELATAAPTAEWDDPAGMLMDVFAHRGRVAAGLPRAVAGPAVQRRAAGRGPRQQGDPGRRRAPDPGGPRDRSPTPRRRPPPAAPASWPPTPCCTRPSAWTPTGTRACWTRARSCCAPTCELPHDASRQRRMQHRERCPAEPPPFPGHRSGRRRHRSRSRPARRRGRRGREAEEEAQAGPGHADGRRGDRGRRLRRADRGPRAGARRALGLRARGPRPRGRPGVEPRAGQGHRVRARRHVRRPDPGPRDQAGRHAGHRPLQDLQRRRERVLRRRPAEHVQRHAAHRLRAAGPDHPAGPGHGDLGAERDGGHRARRTRRGARRAPASGTARRSRAG